MSARAALVVVNAGARHGAARRLYARVRPEVTERYALQETEMDAAGEWQNVIGRAVASGVRTFIAAGGDGTVNAVATTLVTRHGRVPCSELRLGAIALGSSNDFHKPFRRGRAGIPMRIDAAEAQPRDVGRAVWEDARGQRQERVFLVSASLGATATANAFFGEGDRLLRALKPHLPQAAIVYAAMHTLIRHENRPAILHLPEGSESVRLSNLSVLKTPYLAGVFRYDTPVEPRDSLFAVNLCHDMSRARLLATLAALARGRFLGRPGTRHVRTDRLSVELSEPGALELDGEVYRTRRVAFDLLPERLNVCA